ncbi:response regulator [Kitasatospora sp. Ki12]
MSGRVLVVDDNEVIRQLIRVNLELEGFEVVTAADGAECLEIIRRVKPDVVTLDVMMPRLDGLRTAARLRATPDTRRLPIAIVSACTPADLDLGETVGVDGYLGKPFDPADLVALVRRLMRLGGGDDGGLGGEPAGERGGGFDGGVGGQRGGQRGGRTGGFRPERTERTDRG